MAWSDMICLKRSAGWVSKSIQFLMTIHRVFDWKINVFLKDHFVDEIGEWQLHIGIIIIDLFHLQVRWHVKIDSKVIYEVVNANL